MDQRVTPSFQRLSQGGLGYRIARWSTPGSGQAILALHGFTGSGVDFAPLAARVPGEWFAPDLLGHAGSETPGPERFAFAAQVEDLLALPAALGLTRPLLVGYSYGGRLALGLLARAPEAFAGAVLIGASPGLADASARALRRADDLLRADSIRRLGTDRFLASWARRPLLATQARIAPAARELMAAARGLHRELGLARALQGAGLGSMPDLSPALAGLPTPCLLLSGAEDPKFTALARSLAPRLGSARVVIVVGAGHCAHLERPGAAADAIAGWRRGIALRE